MFCKLFSNFIISTTIISATTLSGSFVVRFGRMIFCSAPALSNIVVTTVKLSQPVHLAEDVCFRVETQSHRTPRKEVWHEHPLVYG